VNAWLVLDDGTRYAGRPLGAQGTTAGELVFNTGMTGYQEVMSDPSYAGQIVLFTYPLIGNYGINPDDFESAKVRPSGIVVREACEVPSNWRSRVSLDAFMKERGLTGITGVDTRAVTQRIRSQGVTMATVTHGDPDEAFRALQQAARYSEIDFVRQVTTRAPYAWGHNGEEPLGQPAGDYRATMVVIDCGVKFNILRRFAAVGVRSIVIPATATADEVLAWQPAGVLLSPGPGDPVRLPEVVQTVQGLIGKVPLFGICLGNQVLCQAVGGKTYKLPFGHRGANHPVKDLRTGQVTITSQNHGYAVDGDSLSGSGAEVTQINVNDGTVEGIEVTGERAYSIQYHPEAAPGPWDSRHYFTEFLREMKR
jgi:carbamoyl-phosphate synthase small subunit